MTRVPATAGRLVLPVPPGWFETGAVEPDRAGSGNAGPPHEVIRTPDQRLRVFVSSTLEELAEERQAVARAITALGGSMVHFAGYTPRIHPSDFRTSTRDGVGADRPIAYEDLKRY